MKIRSLYLIVFIFIFSLVITLTFSLLFSTVAEAGWSTSGRDLANSNQSNYNGPVPLTVYRRYDFPGMISESSPVVSEDGTIYVLFQKPTRLGAYKDGELLWLFEGTGNGSQHGAPAIDSEGNIYFVDWDTSINAATLIKLSPDGDEIFRRPTNTFSFTSTHNQLADLKVLTNDSIVGVFGYSGAYQLVTKNNEWWKNRDTLVGAWAGSLPGYNWIEYNRVAVDSQGNMYLAGINGIRKVAFDEDLDEYVILWSRAVRGRTGAVISHDEKTIYRYDTYNGILLAMDVSNGTTIWSVPVSNNSPWSQTNGVSLTHNGNIFLTNGSNHNWTEQKIRLFSPDGELIWERDGFAGEPFVSAANGVLYGHQNGQTVALDESTGELLWSFTSGWGAWAGLVLLDDGTAYSLHRSYMYEYRTWTEDITSVAAVSIVANEGTYTITVESSMLPKDIVTGSPNLVQAKMHNEDIVNFEYSYTNDADMSVWIGTWDIPFQTESGTYTGTVSLFSYNSTTNQTLSYTMPENTSVLTPIFDLGDTGEWDSMHTGFTPTVIENNGTFTMWYAGYDSSTWRIGQSTSNDGINWQKSPINNCSGTTGVGCVFDVSSAGNWDSTHVMGITVKLIEDTYHMWYSGNNGTSYRIGYATSSDGIAWTRAPHNNCSGTVGDGCVFDISASTNWDSRHVYYPSILVEDDELHMWYSGHNNTLNRIGYATSSDGINWSRLDSNHCNTGVGDGCIIDIDVDNSWISAHVVSSSVIFNNTNNRYEMWLSGHDSTTWRTGMATSIDRINWEFPQTDNCTSISSSPGCILDIGDLNLWILGDLLINRSHMYRLHAMIDSQGIYRLYVNAHDGTHARPVQAFLNDEDNWQFSTRIIDESISSSGLSLNFEYSIQGANIELIDNIEREELIPTGQSILLYILAGYCTNFRRNISRRISDIVF